MKRFSMMLKGPHRGHRKLLIGALAIALWIGGARGSAQTVSVSIADTTGKKGDTLLIPIRVGMLAVSDSVYSGQMNLSYDSGVIEVFGIETSGTIAAGLDIAFNATTKRVAFASTGIVTGSGDFLNLRARVRTNPTRDTTTIWFADTAFNEGKPKISLNPGLFRVLKMQVTPKTPPSVLVVGDSLQFSVTGDQIPPLTWSSTDTSVARVDPTGKLFALSSGQLKVHVQDSQGLQDSTNLFAVYPVQAGSLTVSVPDTSHTQTLHFNLPIYISNVTGLNILSAQITLNFSSTRLQATDVILAGSMTAGWSAPSFNITSGQIEIALAGTEPLVGSGVLAYVRLRVQPAASGVSNVTFAGVLFNENLTANTSSGQFTPLPAPTVVVSPATSQIVRGDSLLFSVTSGGAAPFVWSSSNPSVASINPSTGWLLGKERGTVTVSVVDSFGFMGTSGSIVVTDVQVSFPDTAVWPLDTIDVPVLVDDVSGLGIFALEMRVRYDSALVQFLSVETAGTLTGSFNVSYKDTLDTLRIAAAGTSALAGSGHLLNLRFVPKVDTPATSFLSLVKSQFNEPGAGTPTALMTNGSLSIVEAAAVPVLMSPPDDTVDLPLTVPLVWYAATGAISYGIQVSTDSAFVSTIIDSVGLMDSVLTISGLSANTMYFWRVNATNSGGSTDFSAFWRFKTTTVLSAGPQDHGLPRSFHLGPNFPNPFNPTTTISFELPVRSMVRLSAFDLLGNEVARVIDGFREAGVYQSAFDASKLASGIYFYRLEATPSGSSGFQPFVKTGKMILLK